jgi:hypothetical protein
MWAKRQFCFYIKSLYDKPSGNDYTVVNQFNGKYSVEDNGMVGNISLTDFEKKIKNESSPKTNFT